MTGGRAEGKEVGGEIRRRQELLASWEGVLLNVTGWGCGGVFCHGPQKTVRMMDADHSAHGERVTVTPSVMARMRVLYAMGRYSIPSEFDSWQGYTAERLQLLQVCVCVCARARACVCVQVRERERESMCVSGGVSIWGCEWLHACCRACALASERASERACVRVCVCACVRLSGSCAGAAAGVGGCRGVWGRFTQRVGRSAPHGI